MAGGGGMDGITTCRTGGLKRPNHSATMANISAIQVTYFNMVFLIKIIIQHPQKKASEQLLTQISKWQKSCYFGNHNHHITNNVYQASMIKEE
jgi:hypothetical protein